MHVSPSSALASEGSGGHCEAHIARSIDEFENGGGGLVFLFRFDAQDASVPARSMEVAFADGSEKFWEELARSLNGEEVSKAQFQLKS